MAQPSYTIYNLYNTTLTYQSQAITAGSSYTPPTTTSQAAFASDISLLNDVGIGYIGINFGSGSGTITGPSAVTALKNLASLIPVNTLVTAYNADGSGNSINSQSNALNVNTKTSLVYSAPTTAIVNTTSTLILAANSSRLGLYLSNTSTQQISLGFGGNAAVYQNGITLFPGEKFWMDEYSFNTGAVYAITTGSSTYIGIQEIT